MSEQARGQESTDYTGEGSDDLLAVQLSELARSLQDEGGSEQTLAAIVNSAVSSVPGAQYASISKIKGRRQGFTVASSDDLATQSDQAQYDSGEGPCLSTLYDSRTVRASDLATEKRWPEFSKRAHALGVGSMLSIQLYVEDTNLGALNLFNTRTGEAPPV